jgi:hypothetical protein
VFDDAVLVPNFGLQITERGAKSWYVDDALEDAALEPLPGQFGEEAALGSRLNQTHQVMALRVGESGRMRLAWDAAAKW